MAWHVLSRGRNFEQISYIHRDIEWYMDESLFLADLTSQEKKCKRELTPLIFNVI